MSAAPVWTDGRGWRVGARPVVTIGVAGGAEEYQFTSIAGIARLSDGTLVIGDRMAWHVRYYSPRGQYLRTVGRRGDGPGEFKIIQWMGQRGDSVVVWDLFASRLTVLDPAGRVARAVHAAAAERLTPTGVGVMEDGSLLLSTSPADPAWRSEGEYTDSITYLRISLADGHPLGTIGPYLQGEHVITIVGRNSLAGNVIFGRRGQIAVGPRRFFTGETNTFVLTAHTPDGSTVRAFGRPHTPAPASGEDVRAELEQRRGEEDLGKMYPPMGAVQRKQLASLPHRDTLPAFSRILVDGEENVWVEEFRIDPSAAATWTVFDPNGRWLGSVQTPAGLKVMRIAGGTVIGVTKDQDGVERVVVYPLIR